MEAALIFWALAATGLVVFLLVRNKPEPKTFDAGRHLSLDYPPFDVVVGIKKEAEKYGLAPEMCLALAEDESSFSPTAVNIQENAIGVFQIREIAFQEFVNRGKNTGGWTHNQLIDPAKNITVGVWYLAWLRDTLKKQWGREPSHREIILAFKGGIGNVLKKTTSDTAELFTERTLAREVKFA